MMDNVTRLINQITADKMKSDTATLLKPAHFPFLERMQCHQSLLVHTESCMIVNSSCTLVRPDNG